MLHAERGFFMCNIVPNTTFLKFISIIQRNTARYFDMGLESDQIGSGQQFFLLRIAENQGITMFDLAQTGSFDKGTVTRAVQKLVSLGYVRMVIDKHDRRVRHLYTTPEAQHVVEHVYKRRNEWRDQITKDFTPEEQEQIFMLLYRIANNAQREIALEQDKNDADQS